MAGPWPGSPWGPVEDKSEPAIIARTYGDVRPEHLLAQAKRIRLTATSSRPIGAGGVFLYAGHDSGLVRLKSPVGRTSGTASQKQLRNKHPWEGSWRQDCGHDEQEPNRRPRLAG